MKEHKATCEICGRDGVVAVVFVEGAKLAVCGGCVRGKKVIYQLEDTGSLEPQTVQRIRSEETEEIVEGYGKIIKKAREEMGLPLSVVAERINEKESYIERIEREQIIPTFAVAKKLEKELKIKLIEKTRSGGSVSTNTFKKFSEPTLGEMLDDKREGR